MTAVREQAPPTSPQVFVRIAWVLHRAYYRLTGGRRGLWRPKAGAKFGTMRLTTTGRRSGQPRVAIVGYYEDGPNLVTLAMNGWAEAEPAWWLNLQAQPETVVELKDGPRAVRARVAAGAERERLWASFRDYPGWGDASTRSPRGERRSGRWSCSSLAQPPDRRGPGVRSPGPRLVRPSSSPRTWRPSRDMVACVRTLRQNRWPP
jgi:F420H(2)-dependent quinone reductase